MMEKVDEERILHTARGIEDTRLRADYLEPVCGADQMLRLRVEQLLDASDDQAGPLLSNHQLPETATSDSATDRFS